MGVPSTGKLAQPKLYAPTRYTAPEYGRFETAECARATTVRPRTSQTTPLGIVASSIFRHFRCQGVMVRVSPEWH